LGPCLSDNNGRIQLLLGAAIVMDV
jgi:hypothetical protein